MDISREERAIRSRQTLRTTGVLALAAVVFVFAVVNTHEVTIDYAFDEAGVPLIVVIAAVGLIGLLVGAVAGRRSS